MKILYIALSLSTVFLTGCEVTKGITRSMTPNYRCSKCGTEILMMSDTRAKKYCPKGGKHEWRRIINR